MVQRVFEQAVVLVQRSPRRDPGTRKAPIARAPAAPAAGGGCGAGSAGERKGGRAEEKRRTTGVFQIGVDGPGRDGQTHQPASVQGWRQTPRSQRQRRRREAVRRRSISASRLSSMLWAFPAVQQAPGHESRRVQCRVRPKPAPNQVVAKIRNAVRHRVKRTGRRNRRRRYGPGVTVLSGRERAAAERPLEKAASPPGRRLQRRGQPRAGAAARREWRGPGPDAVEPDRTGSRKDSQGR